MRLPDISAIKKSEKAFSKSFLSVSHILSQYLEQIELTVAVNKQFTSEPFNLIALSLFSKLRRHYYSFVLLETSHDQVGSQLLVEHLYEAAITLTYLLEEADERLFSDYVAASIRQAHHLLLDIESRLQVFSNHLGLLALRDKLRSYIAQQQKHPVTLSVAPCSEPYVWGLQDADTTAKRATLTNLNFLTNPARSISLSVVPASCLDLQLNYFRAFAGGSTTKTESSINFTYLRDTSHLCLHATRTFLEEVANTYQDGGTLEIRRLDKSLDKLFEWFYRAYEAYKVNFSIREEIQSLRVDSSLLRPESTASEGCC
jgi:hypothetical protein